MHLVTANEYVFIGMYIFLAVFLSLQYLFFTYLALVGCVRTQINKLAFSMKYFGFYRDKAIAIIQMLMY